MPSIHGHEVLQMMISSDESYTVATLEAAIIARFGKEARFHTCSAENLSAAELVAFLQKKASLLPLMKGLIRTKVKFAAINLAASAEPRCRLY